MEKINPKELTQEQIQKVMACENAEELMALAKAEGTEITKEEAEEYFAAMENYAVDLSDEDMAKVAGGSDNDDWEDHDDSPPDGF